MSTWMSFLDEAPSKDVYDYEADAWYDTPEASSVSDGVNDSFRSLMLQIEANKTGKYKYLVFVDLEKDVKSAFADYANSCLRYPGYARMQFDDISDEAAKILESNQQRFDNHSEGGNYNDLDQRVWNEQFAIKFYNTFVDRLPDITPPMIFHALSTHDKSEFENDPVGDMLHTLASAENEAEFVVSAKSTDTEAANHGFETSEDVVEVWHERVIDKRQKAVERKNPFIEDPKKAKLLNRAKAMQENGSFAEADIVEKNQQDYSTRF